GAGGNRSDAAREPRAQRRPAPDTTGVSRTGIAGPASGTDSAPGATHSRSLGSRKAGRHGQPARLYQEPEDQGGARPSPATLHRDGGGSGLSAEGRLTRDGYFSETTSFAEWLRQLIGITNDLDPGTLGSSGFSPASTLGTDMTKSRPKSRRALPEIVLA